MTITTVAKLETALAALATLGLLATVAVAEPGADQLLCFKVRDAQHRELRGLALELLARNEALAQSCRLAARARRLCVPAAFTGATAHLALAPAERSSPAFLCYRLDCRDEPTAGTEVVTDRFGLHVFSRTRPGRSSHLLCAPTTPGAGGPRHGSNPPPDDSSAKRRRPSKAGGYPAPPDTPTAVSQRVVCGDFTGDDVISATDALGVLRAAVGAEECPRCVCDVDNSGSTVATDGLALLKFAVGASGPLNCASGGNPVKWVGLGDGSSWSDPANWDLGVRVPNRCDDVTIEAGLASAVVHDDGDNEIGSLVADSSLRLRSGRLRVAGTLSPAVPVLLSGGTLVDAVVVSSGGAGAPADDGLRFSAVGGTLVGVSAQTDLGLGETAALVRVRESLMLSGTAELGDFSQILFEAGADQTLSGGGTIRFIGDARGFLSLGPDVELRIADDVTVSGGSALLGSGTAASRLINEGLIEIDRAGQIRVRSGGGWINQGTLRAGGGGDLYLDDEWTNDGEITISGGGRLTLGGSWRNRGTMRATNSSVDLGGEFTLDSLGSLIRQGGTVRVTGALDNPGSLVLDDSTGPWQLAGGTIFGGSVIASGSGDLVHTITGGTLVGTTMETGMNLSAGNAFVRVELGLELNGTASLGPGAQILFQGIGEQILAGNGEIVFEGTNDGGFVSVGNGTTLRIAAGMLIRGGTGFVGGADLAARLINEGTIASDAPGIIRVVNNAEGWENLGVVRGSAGGGLRLEGEWTNRGEISISGGGTLTLSGNWRNLGTIVSDVSDASAVNLGGDFTLASLGSFARSGGVVNLSGTLDNLTGLVLDDTTGSWRLSGGTILGGTVATAGNAEIIYTASGGTLHAVTMNADVDLSSSPAFVRISDGITLGGTAITVGPSAQMLFEGVGEQTLGGNGEVRFAGSEQGFIGVADGVTLRIGSGIVVHGGNGLIGSETVSTQISNDGTLDSDAPGQLRVRAGGGVFNNFGGTMRASVDEFRADNVLINDGRLEAAAGLRFVVQADLTLRSTSSVSLGIDAAGSAAVLEVDGVAALDGLLELDISPGFAPDMGDTFTVVIYDSRFGEFLGIDGLGLGDERRLAPTYTDSSLLLTVVPG